MGPAGSRGRGNLPVTGLRRHWGMLGVFGRSVGGKQEKQRPSYHHQMLAVVPEENYFCSVVLP